MKEETIKTVQRYALREKLALLAMGDDLPRYYIVARANESDHFNGVQALRSSGQVEPDGLVVLEFHVAEFVGSCPVRPFRMLCNALGKPELALMSDGMYETHEEYEDFALSAMEQAPMDLDGFILASVNSLMWQVNALNYTTAFEGISRTISLGEDGPTEEEIEALPEPVRSIVLEGMESGGDEDSRPRQVLIACHDNPEGLRSDYMQFYRQLGDTIQGEQMCEAHGIPNASFNMRWDAPSNWVRDLSDFGQFVEATPLARIVRNTPEADGGQL